MGLRLTRNKGERIFINGDQIIIEIIEIKSRNQVSIDITAPENISIHREEIYKLIKNNAEETGKTYE